jgi:hypothetical protein
MYGDKQTCATCVHHHREPTIELRPAMLCRRNPPTVTHIPMFSPTGQIAGQASLTGYPKVSEGWTCGQWSARLELTKGAA